MTITETTASHDRQIVEHLTTLTRQRNITPVQLADITAVAPVTVRDWLAGRHSPCYSAVLVWAARLGLRLAVVTLGGEVLAEGADVLFRFRELRERAGLTQVEVAARLCIRRPNVGARERQVKDRYLVTVAAHVAALGYRLVLLEVS